MQTIRQFTQVSYDALPVGALAWFRCNGDGVPRLVRVQPRGHLGQRYVCFIDPTTGADLPDGQIGVGWNELFHQYAI